MLFEKLFNDKFCLNIFFTLLLGLISIYIYDKSKYKILGILSAILIGIIAEFSKMDYGFYGIAIIFFFYLFKNNYILSSIAFILATTIKYIIPFIKYGYHDIILYLLIGTLSSILFISFYNGKKGKDTKYFLYLFYPLHLLLLYGIYLIK